MIPVLPLRSQDSILWKLNMLARTFQIHLSPLPWRQQKPNHRKLGNLWNRSVSLLLNMAFVCLNMIFLSTISKLKNQALYIAVSFLLMIVKKTLIFMRINMSVSKSFLLSILFLYLQRQRLSQPKWHQPWQQHLKWVQSKSEDLILVSYLYVHQRLLVIPRTFYFNIIAAAALPSQHQHTLDQLETVLLFFFHLTN